MTTFIHGTHCTYLLPITVVGAFAVFSCACSAQVKLNVSLGANDCRQAAVPGVPPFFWSVDPATADKDALTLVFQPDDLNGPEFRAPVVNSSELYFAAVPHVGLAKRIGPYSREKYAVDIHASGPVREIKAEDWMRARRLEHSKVPVIADYNSDDDNKNVSYKDNAFNKSGEHLSYAIRSANDRWIAVFSYDGQQRFIPPEQRGVGTIGIPAPTKHPNKGVLYVDVYDVATGQKAVAMKGPFQGEIANNWFLTASFLSDRFFFMNTGERTDQISQFWICELPAAASK